jgi:hypothetical protein
MFGSWRVIRDGLVVNKPVEISMTWGFRTVVTTNNHGQFSVTTTCPSKSGAYSIIATVYEDQDLQSCSQTIALQVIEYIETTLLLSCMQTQQNMGLAAKFYGMLQEKNSGRPVAGKTILLTVMGGGSSWTYTLTTDSNGYYELIYTNNNGIFNWAEARFNGDALYLPSQSGNRPPIVVSTSSRMTSTSTSSITRTTTSSSTVSSTTASTTYSTSTSTATTQTSTSTPTTSTTVTQTSSSITTTSLTTSPITTTTVAQTTTSSTTTPGTTTSTTTSPTTSYLTTTTSSTTIYTTTGSGTSTTTTTSGATTYTTTESSTVTTTTQTTNGPSYIIFVDPVDPDMIKAKNGITGKIDFSGNDAAAVLQRAIDALSSTGGTITLRSGTYVWESVPALPKDLPNWLKIIGESGVIIKLTEKGARAFDFRKTADYDTFQYIWLEGFTIDCNNIGGKHHVVLGTYVSGTATSRINLQNIVIRQIKTVNVPVDATEVKHRVNVCLLVRHPATGETQTSIKDIWIEDCTFLGGNQGVVIGGQNGAAQATGYNIFLDRIFIHRCYHSLLNVQSTGFSSVNFHIGYSGFGGYAHVADCYGEYSGDVGVEIDNMNALVENCVMRDAYDVEYFHTNYNNLLTPNEQLVTFKNCTARRISLANTSTSIGFKIRTSLSTGLGSVVMENCKFYCEGGKSGTFALDFEPTDGFQRFAVRGFKANIQSISVPSGDNSLIGITIVPSGGSARGSVSLREIDITMTGALSGGTVNIWPVYVSGVMDLEIDDLTLDVNVTGIPDYTVSGLFIGPEAGSSIAGTIRNYRIKRITTDAHPRGIRVFGTDTLTIPGLLRIEDCDFSGLPVGGEPILFTAPSNISKVHFA